MCVAEILEMQAITKKQRHIHAAELPYSGDVCHKTFKVASPRLGHKHIDSQSI